MTKKMKMTLIDKDKLIQDVISRKYSQASMRLIREQPEVKAIPIEWFEWLLDTMGDGMYNLRAVIKDWERYKEDWEKRK